MKPSAHRDDSRTAHGASAASTAATLAALLIFSALTGCATPPRPTVCFSPGGHCADDVIREVGTARKSIYVQAYGFTHPGIAKALVDAAGRGVDVEVILDKSNISAHSSEAGLIARAGVKTYIDSRHPIAHDKVIVIDKAEVITGSFNFTRAADERNAENLLVIKSVPLAADYISDWQMHESHSAPFITSETGD